MNHARYAPLLFALSLGSCAHEPAPAPESSAPAASSGGASASASRYRPDLKIHMGETFWDAVDARDALLAGDLTAAQESARALRDRKYADSLPIEWKTFIGDLRMHADALAMAPDLDTAASELGLIALSCGNCHWYTKHGPIPLPDPRIADPVPGEEQLFERMVRHAIGSEQMWDGLIIPSDDAWRQGTVTFTRAPLGPPVDKDSTVDGETHARIEALRGVAREARVAESHKKRAELYGKLVAGCAGCHYTRR